MQTQAFRQESPVSPPPLKAVYYARRNQFQPPFLVEVDLKPYVPNPQENHTIVELSPCSVTSRPLGFQANPNPGQVSEGFNPNPNPNSNQGFSTCARIWSGIFCAFSFANTFTAFVFFILMTTNSFPNDSWSDDALVFCIISTFVYGSVLLMRIGHLFMSCNLPFATGMEKFGVALSMFCPPLKYHMAALNQNTTLKLKAYAATDIVANCLEILAATLAIIGGVNSKYDCQYDYYYQKIICRTGDPIIINFAIELFCNCCFSFPITYLIHSNFITNTIRRQKNEEMTQQLLPYAAQYGVINTNPAYPGMRPYQPQPPAAQPMGFPGYQPPAYPNIDSRQ